MSAEYPESIYDPRVLENKPGFEYDPDDKTVLFAEDFNGTSEEIRAIEDTLGLLPAPFSIPVDGMLPYLYGIQQKIYKEVRSVSGTPPYTFPSGITVAIPITPGSTPGRPFVKVTGGRFRIQTGLSSTFYGMHCYVERLSDVLYQVFINYLNESTRAFVAPPSAGPTSTITLDPTVNVEFDYNPNIFSI